MLSVEGQRSRPSRRTRLDRLKAVASSPASFAKPDGVKPWREARESMASQMALDDSISAPFEENCPFKETEVLCSTPPLPSCKALAPPLASAIPPAHDHADAESGLRLQDRQPRRLRRRGGGRRISADADRP